MEQHPIIGGESAIQAFKDEVEYSEDDLFGWQIGGKPRGFNCTLKSFDPSLLKVSSA